MAGLIVLDASVLIAHLEGDDAHADAAAEILAGSDALAASTLTLAEVLAGPARAGRLDAAVAALSELEVEEIPQRTGDAAALARIRAETRLRMPDCCVLHAATVTEADAVGTRDAPLRRAAAQRGFAVP